MRKLLYIGGAVLVSLLSYSCSRSSGVETSSNNEMDLNVSTKMSYISADQYISSMLSSKPKLRSQSLDLDSIDFSGSQVASLPLSDTFLDDRGFIKPGKTPVVSAYRVDSLMDTSDEAMHKLLNGGNYSKVGSESFTLDTIRLNYTDQYVYQVEVPGVGYVADGFSPTTQISDLSGQSIYEPALVYGGFSSPKGEISLQRVAKHETLPSLPRKMRGELIQSNTLKEANKVYWFFPAPKSDRVIVESIGQGKFRGIMDDKKYQFVSVSSGTTLSTQDKSLMVFEGQKGMIIELEVE